MADSSKKSQKAHSLSSQRRKVPVNTWQGQGGFVLFCFLFLFFSSSRHHSHTKNVSFVPCGFLLSSTAQWETLPLSHLPSRRVEQDCLTLRRLHWYSDECSLKGSFKARPYPDQKTKQKTRGYVDVCHFFQFFTTSEGDVWEPQRLKFSAHI